MVEFDLPIEIIQHIQSFLDDRDEGNRTCILSKSWYEAWSTRPILAFRKNLKYKHAKQMKYVNKTEEEHAEIRNLFRRIINRYKKLNLPLQKLILHIYIGRVEGYSGLIHQLIAGAKTLGTTELDFMTDSTYDFPVQAFHITSLTKLSISDCRCERIEIDQLAGRVLCSGLAFLKLHEVRIDYHVIRHVLLGCPLIRNLALEFVSIIDDNKAVSNDRVLCPSLVSFRLAECDLGQRSIQDILSGSPLTEKLKFRYLNILFPAQVWAARSFKSLSFSDCRIQIDNDTTICSRLVSLRCKSTHIEDDVIRHILLRCPLIENLHLDKPSELSCINMSAMHNLVSLSIRSQHWDNNPLDVYFESITSGSNVPEFKRLRLLSLEFVKVDVEFFNKFSTRFPCIEDLTLCFFDGYEEIQISSRSVKYLKLHHWGVLQKAEFNIPNIHRFVYYGHKGIPSLSFHTGSSNWESKVELCFPSSRYVDLESFSPTAPIIDSCWFVKLRDFLNELSHSRISLSIQVDTSNLICVKDFPSSPTPVVENLIITDYRSSSANRAYLCGLFGCCRPTLITFHCRREYSYTYWFAQILHEILLYQDTKRISRVQSSLMYDLEEIDVELYGKLGWQTIPLTESVEDAAIISLDKDVRFRFKWGAFKCT